MNEEFDLIGFFSSPAAHSIQQIENLSFVEGRARQPINSSFLHQPPKQRNNISFFGLLNEKKRLNLIEGNASIPSIVLICLHSHYAKTNNWFHSNYFSKTSSQQYLVDLINVFIKILRVDRSWPASSGFNPVHTMKSRTD